MIISSWNVNGLRAVAKKTFFPWVNEFQPDILCLQETKLQQDQLSQDLINMTGYTSYFSFAEKKGYSGTAVYSKIPPDDYKVNHFPVTPAGEGRIIELQFSSFILYNVYFPNGQMNETRLQAKLQFYDEFYQYFHTWQKKGKSILITGDFNTAHQPIDLAEPEKHRHTSGFLDIEREKIDFYLQQDLVDVFRYLNPHQVAYTYWSNFANSRVRNLGWRIDYFLASSSLLSMVQKAPIHSNVMGSDHCPCSVILQ